MVKIGDELLYEFQGVVLKGKVVKISQAGGKTIWHVI
jgi:hypothetical protein